MPTGEAKNLLPYLGPHKMRDCFCTINLDQEEVYRTQVVEKSLRLVEKLVNYDFYYIDWSILCLFQIIIIRKTR